MKTLAVMDYSSAEIHLYKFPNSADIDDSTVESLGHNTNECYWMAGKDIEVVNHLGIYVTGSSPPVRQQPVISFR